MDVRGDWSEWRNHVLKELVRQNDNIDALADKLDVFEKTCLQKEGDQKAVNAETRMKLYLMDMLMGAAGALAMFLIQHFLFP